MRGLKIVFMGVTESGKSTIRKAFFEQENPLKLLWQSFQRTQGINLEIIELEKPIEIHDLAKPHLEDGLTDSIQVINNADLIITVLDAGEEFEVNLKIWERVIYEKRRICPKAHLMILFHKFDLLPESAQKELDLRIKTTFIAYSDITAFTSSVVPKFFLATFRNFTKGIHQCIVSLRDTKLREIFEQVEIVTNFIDQGTQNLSHLLSSLHLPPKAARRVLENMHKQNYIYIDEGSNLVSLGEQGLYLIEGLSNAAPPVPKMTLNELPLVKGIIFSNTSGLSFYVYEYKPNYFHKLLPRGRKFPQQQFISGFMSTVGIFTTELGKDLKTTVMTGEDSPIISLQFKELIGIFFLEILPFNQSLLDLLLQFLSEFYTKFQGEINQFIAAGATEQFKSRAKQIEAFIANLNTQLHTHVLKHSPVTAHKLIPIYEMLDHANLDPEVARDIKQLIFQYVVTQKEENLAIIDTLLAEHNLYSGI